MNVHRKDLIFGQGVLYPSDRYRSQRLRRSRCQWNLFLLHEGKTTGKGFRGKAVKQRSGYNPKRKIAAQDTMTEDERAELAQRIRYGGNPEHKRNPGDYDLMPPSNPRPGKTLCDASERILKVDAERLLAKGIKKGMVSRQQRNGWPQNVWVVSCIGTVFEAQLENQDQGVYHGYPLPRDDDFRKKVLEEWSRR